jgi:NADPH-dependent 2,4-dienoyl-CoA reductase/sulfur reductase-like enzyme
MTEQLQVEQQISCDILIIGAGPAGMMAAITACESGADVIVLHDKLSPGGQIYRNVDNSPLPDSKVLGEDYTQGAELVARFNACGARVFNSASVWHVGDNAEVLFSYQGSTQRASAREVIVANGAMERPFPIEGWHLPNVMSAGAAQVMLKSDAIVSEDAVFIGTGPLLYLIVAQYLRLGVKVKALIDTTEKANYLKATQQLPKAFAQLSMVTKGLGLLNEIRASGTPCYRFVEDIEISASNDLKPQHASQVTFKCANKTITLESDQFFLHQGVIPNLNITRSLGLAHHWNTQQLCWQPKLDNWGASSVPYISVAGDCSAIVGAIGAQNMGKIVALNLLYRLDMLKLEKRDELAAQAIQDNQQLSRFRSFIDALYRPQNAHRVPEKSTIVVCRCEEQNVAQLEQAFAEKASGPNELKSMTRCGMGPCQGRMCGTTVSELLAKWRNSEVGDVGYYHLRSPMRLLNLEELAKLETVAPRSAQ